MRKQTFICECEDFPCCGHNNEDRVTRIKSFKKALYYELHNIDNEW